ncbi:MAG: SagB/ThcOx family dehydrogenase [Spirochaetia bacterium]
MPEGSAERKEAEEKTRRASAALDLGRVAAVRSAYMARTLPGFLLILTLALTACGAAVAQNVELPPPRTDGDTSLEKAVHRRQSIREFSDTALERDDIGQLLWSAAGRTVDGVSGPTRAAASAGGLYPIRAYIVVGNAEDIEPGVYRYRWRSHELGRVETGDVRRQLRLAALGQGAVGRAPCIVVLAAA